MSYREPGIRLRQVQQMESSSTGSVSLVPVVLGTGAKEFRKREVITRGSGDYDVLPSSNVKEIVRIGNFRGDSDYENYIDFELEESNHVRWLTEEDHIEDPEDPEGEEGTEGGGTEGDPEDPDPEEGDIVTKSPSEGATYYIEYVAGPEPDQYEPKKISRLSEIEDYFGGDIKHEDGTVCNVSLGAKIIKENSPVDSLYVIQIDDSESLQDGYKDAFDNHVEFLKDAYRIVMMESSEELNSHAFKHIREMSSPEEGLERRLMVYPSDQPETFNEALATVGGMAESFSNSRVNIAFPLKATRRLSDDKIHELGAPFVMAAIAGLEASVPPHRSLTNSRISSFIELIGPKMRRTQKNQLAEKGVIVLEQDGGAGSPINVRHGLTTDMSSIQTRENSIVTIADYTAKLIRNTISRYIGRYEIDEELVRQISGSINTALDNLASGSRDERVIIGGEIMEIAQDEDNPDALIVSVGIQPPYPCNKIDITLYVD